MQILVTGASGLLGSAIVNALAQEGNEIRILIRRESDIRAIAHLKCQQVFGDITSFESVQQAIQGCDAVVHAAALTKQSGISLEKYIRINVGGTRNVAEAALQNSDVRIVYVSTASTIRYGSKRNPGSELFDADEDFGSGYIKSKIQAERELVNAAQFRGANAVILNPTFMLGPRDKIASSGELLDFALSNRVLPSPPGGKNFVDVHDVASCIVKALSYGTPGERYLVANENLSYVEFFSLLENLQRTKKYIFKIPRGVWKSAQSALSMFESITGASPGLNSIMMKVAAVESYYTGEKSKLEFGIRYTSISDTLEKILRV
jgi:dihydroflavonol-4-reductase